MVRSPSPEELYLQAADSFVAFVRKVEEEDWSRPVPCCPDWTARDVLGHVIGVAADAPAGRMNGFPGAAWTAAHVAARASDGLEELLEEWDARVRAMAAWVAETGATWPARDCHSHEHDLRHALDLPGNRENPIVTTAAKDLVGTLAVPFPLEVELDGAVVTNGHPELGRFPHEEVVLRGVSAFEIFRSRLGRRSRAQVEQLRWSGPEDRIAGLIDQWFLLGPSAIDIHE